MKLTVTSVSMERWRPAGNQESSTGISPVTASRIECCTSRLGDNSACAYLVYWPITTVRILPEGSVTLYSWAGA